MTEAVNTAIEAIYASLNNNNHEIDDIIKELKAALVASEMKTAVFDPSKLAQNNRQGRKLMQSYFKKRGVNVDFKKE